MNEVAISKRLARVERQQSNHERKVELELSKINGVIKTHGDTQQELLNSIDWLKKELTKGLITIVSFVVGTGIVTVAAIIWGLVINQ